MIGIIKLEVLSRYIIYFDSGLFFTSVHIRTESVLYTNSFVYSYFGKYLSIRWLKVWHTIERQNKNEYHDQELRQNRVEEPRKK